MGIIERNLALAYSIVSKMQVVMDHCIQLLSKVKVVMGYIPQLMFIIRDKSGQSIAHHISTCKLIRQNMILLSQLRPVQLQIKINPIQLGQPHALSS